MKKNKYSLKISRSFFGDTALDGYPIDTYSNDELKILKNLLTKVLCEVNEYIKDISMKHIKFTIDITLPPDEKFLTKNDFIEAVYTCYGNIRDVSSIAIIKID